MLAFTVKTDNTNEYSADLAVVGHEYTHGVTHNISAIRGEETRKKAIRESYADIMGVLVRSRDNDGEPDWDMGVRNLENPENDGYPTNMSQYDESKDGYYNGSIISHTAYLMWEGVDGKKGIKDIEALAKLWYGSLYMLNSDSDFSHCRTAVEITANRLLAKNILSEADVECVKAAFDKTKENRYYFKNEKLFRWIDEAGNTNESDSDNSEFTARGKQILGEVRDRVKY